MQDITIVIDLKKGKTKVTNKIEFGKGINHRPLTVSVILSFLAGGLGLLVNIKFSVILFISIIIILILFYYPSYLLELFGHWQLEKHGISFYKMFTYRDKLKMILNPNDAEFQFISYSQIKSVQVVERDHKYTLADILTIKPAKQSYFPWLRKPFYLEIELNKGNIQLDLSWSQLHDPHNTMFSLSNALNIINNEIN